MQVSNDFLLRIIGTSDGILLPTQKHLVSDYNIEVILKRIGKVQTFLDISRCPHLSSHIVSGLVPSLCQALLHLDISYTRCSDLDIVFNKCHHLQTLNLAGLELVEPHLEGIEHLIDLHVLSIRSSNIEDIAAVRQLELIRSLDLGNTRLRNVHLALDQKTRLEELLLDNCSKLDDVDLSLHVSILPELKLLNVVESDFTVYKDILPGRVRHRVYLEPNSRRQQFFDAIIRDDAKEMYRLLTYGQDMNMRSIKSDVPFLVSRYTDRCTYPKYKIQTPFFLLPPTVTEDKMPAGIHLAIWFNSLECLQALIDQGALKDLQVFASEVKLVEQGLEELLPAGDADTSGNFLRRTLANAEVLVNLAYDRKVHRITEKMIDKQIKHWKHECQKIHKKLLATLEHGSQMKRKLKQQIEEENGKKKASKAKKAPLPAMVEVMEDVEDLDDQSVLSMNSLDRHKQSLDSLDRGSLDEFFPLGASVDQDNVSIASATDVTELSSIGSYTYINPDIFHEEAMLCMKEKTITRPKIVPKKETMFIWRDHGMVLALHGPNRVYQIHEEVVVEDVSKTLQEQKSKGKGKLFERSSTGRAKNKKSLLEDLGSTQKTFRIEDIHVMGKRSYWLESRARILDEREKGGADDTKNESSKNIKSNLGVYGKFQESLTMGKNVYLTEKEKEENWLANRKAGSMPFRKQLFLQAVKERMEKKFSDNM